MWSRTRYPCSRSMCRATRGKPRGKTTRTQPRRVLFHEPRVSMAAINTEANPAAYAHPHTSFRVPVSTNWEQADRRPGVTDRQTDMARFALAAAALLLAVAASGAAAQGVGSVITEAMYNSMLPNRDNSQCPARGFYTYDAFIAAANSFPQFGTSGSADQIKRELAAFFGQTSHETTGGTKGNSDQFQWGYCFKEEIGKTTSPPYYGRGPIQLTGQSNYQLAGNALNADLVGNPDLVSTDAVISFKTAIWFWMTPQSPKPSSHDVILGNWTPSATDSAAGRVPGYGVITNIINGGFECGRGTNDNGGNEDRIGYYKRYCDMLGVGYGDNLDCYNQQQFG